MYLNRLYHENKKLFYIFCIAIGFHILALKFDGLRLFPFINYGMFSEVSRPKENYIIDKICMNDSVLLPLNYSPHIWDHMKYTLSFINYNKNETEYTKRFIHNKLHYQGSLNFLDNRKDRIESLNDFKSLIGRLTKWHVNQITLVRVRNDWSNGKFVTLDTISMDHVKE